MWERSMRAPCSMKRALQPEISVIQFGRRTETVVKADKRAESSAAAGTPIMRAMRNGTDV